MTKNHIASSIISSFILSTQRKEDINLRFYTSSIPHIISKYPMLTLDSTSFLFLESKRRDCGISIGTIGCGIKISSNSFTLLIAYRRSSMNDRYLVTTRLYTTRGKDLGHFPIIKRILSRGSIPDNMRFSDFKDFFPVSFLFGLGKLF